MFYLINSGSENSERRKVLLEVGLWLGFLVSIIQILLLRSTQALGLFIDLKIDRGQLTAADLAIKLDNLPPG